MGLTTLAIQWPVASYTSIIAYILSFFGLDTFSRHFLTISSMIIVIGTTLHFFPIEAPSHQEVLDVFLDGEGV